MAPSNSSGGRNTSSMRSLVRLMVLKTPNRLSTNPTNTSATVYGNRSRLTAMPTSAATSINRR